MKLNIQIELDIDEFAAGEELYDVLKDIAAEALDTEGSKTITDITLNARKIGWWCISDAR